MKNNLKSLILLLFCTVLFVSCVSQSPYIIDHPEFTENGAPYWTVLTPVSKDRFYGVGSGNLSTVQNSKIRAEAIAKNEIARQVSTIVQSSINNYFNENELDKNKIDVFESLSAQITNATLRNVIIENNYIDEETGTIWVIASYEKSNLKEAYELETKNIERSLQKRKLSVLEEISKLKEKNKEQIELNKNNESALEALSQAYNSILSSKQNNLNKLLGDLDVIDIKKLVNSYDKQLLNLLNEIGDD